MINQLRKASEHIYTRIIIGLMIVAFISWGVNDFKKNYSGEDIVQFKYLQNISFEEFSIRKRENLIRSYKQDGSKDSKTQDAELNYLTLNQLINERIIDSIIKDYELDINKEIFVEYIKGIKIFQNENGVFDKELFDKMLSSSSLSPEEFISSYKRMLLENLIFSIYQSSTYVPDLLKENILNYILDKRTFDLVSIDLANKTESKIQNYTEEELEDFYLQNQKLFESPESRKLNYVVIDYKNLLHDPELNDSDLIDYYENNKENFENKTFNESKSEIESILKSKDQSNQIDDFVKLLEDEIASGLSLRQISQKRNFDIFSIENFTENYKITEPYLKDFKDSIMGMQEREVSYPVEIKNGLIIFEIEKIRAAEIPPLKDIRIKVLSIFENNLYKKLNLETMQNFTKTTNFNNFIEQASRNGFDIKNNISISRNKTYDEKNLPELLLNEIFITNSGEVTKLVVHNDIAYVAKINNVSSDSITKDAKDKIKQNINNNIKQNTIDDMITHLKHKNQIRVNTKLLEKEE